MDQPLTPSRTFKLPLRSWHLVGGWSPARMHHFRHVETSEAAHREKGARETVVSRRNCLHIYSPPSGSAVPLPLSSVRQSSESPLWPESTELVLLLATKRALA